MTSGPTRTSVGAGWARLTAGVADRVVAATVQDMHRAISDGAFRRVGPLGRRVQVVHDRVTGGVYAILRASLRGVGEVAASVSDARAREQDLLESDLASASARKARAIAHGVVSADLLELAPVLDQEVTIRLRGRSVAPDGTGLRAAYPQAEGRVAVFVHGLVDTEDVWAGGDAEDRSSPPEPPGLTGLPGLPELTGLPGLAAAAGHTPVLLRYGTGRPVARSGRELARLLDELVEHWPVEITRLTLVGHSMGGLVIRSALADGGGDARWARTVSDVVYLGTPHLGSWLEKAANSVSWTLRLHPHSAPIGRLLDRRSPGIKDLRFGTLTEQAWSEAGIDDLLTGRGADPPFGGGMTHHLVVGGLGRSDRNAVRYVVGDALVRTTSARGAGRTRTIAHEGTVEVVYVPGVSHTRLARHPAVADILDDILRA